MDFSLLSSGTKHDRTVIVLVTHSKYIKSLDMEPARRVSKNGSIKIDIDSNIKHNKISHAEHKSANANNITLRIRGGMMQNTLD